MPSRKWLLCAALVGLGFCGIIGYLARRGADQEQEIQALRATIESLRQSRADHDASQIDGDSPARAEGSSTSGDPQTLADSAQGKTADDASVAGRAAGSFQVLRDLERVSDSDRRSYLEKLQTLLSGEPEAEDIAIASRFIFEKAADREGLPDYALQSLYAGQRDPDLRRVIAQVLAQRGNSALLNNQIAETQAKLSSNRPRERQEALAQLARTHSSKAVDAIAPLLQDPDTTVRLEALFALRDTGNQQHVHLAEPLLNDPDPSVRTLAADVLASLRNLSATARTNYSRADIEAELPPIANP